MKVLREVNGSIVENILKTTASKHGTPVQIIADHGSDVKKGIEDFCQYTSSVKYTYDVTHKCALLLKHILKNDMDWTRFCAACGECRRDIINTDFIIYAPPKARDKSRHLNLERYVKWVNNILYVSRHKGNKESAKFQQYFAWVKKFKKKMKIWQQLMAVLHVAKTEITCNGLTKNTWSYLKNKLIPFNKTLPQTVNLLSNLKEYILQETLIIPEGEAWPGSSDIIESIFGRFKHHASKSPIRDISRMAITIPIFTCPEIKDKLKVILEFKTIKNTLRWLQNNIGESATSKRRKAFKVKRINKY